MQQEEAFLLLLSAPDKNLGILSSPQENSTKMFILPLHCLPFPAPAVDSKFLKHCWAISCAHEASRQASFVPLHLAAAGQRVGAGRRVFSP